MLHPAAPGILQDQANRIPGMRVLIFGGLPQHLSQETRSLSDQKRNDGAAPLGLHHVIVSLSLGIAEAGIPPVALSGLNELTACAHGGKQVIQLFLHAETDLFLPVIHHITGQLVPFSPQTQHFIPLRLPLPDTIGQFHQLSTEGVYQH